MEFDAGTIKEAMLLADYIQTHYPDEDMVSRGGSEFICCPVHEDKEPSCLLNDYTYKCFSCGATGSVIDYVAAKEGYELPADFLRVCQRIGQQVGIEVVITPPNPHHEAYKDEMDALNQRYWKELKANTEAVNYLVQERGLTPETIQAFRLGATPADEYVTRGRGFISNRLVFPILEMKAPMKGKRAKCIGMAYRVLEKDSDEPKYVNDPNQDGGKGKDPNLKGVFIKGETLYGYPQAYDEIRKRKFAIVVEGYMDVISMHQAGLRNTVGCMGTALTEVQMTILRKLTSNIYLFLDSDTAGQNNMVRVLPALLAKGFTVKIINGTNGKDPADICKEFGFVTDRVNRYIKDHSEYAVTTVIDQCCQSYEEAVIRERTMALRAITPLLETIQDPCERLVYQKMLYKKLDLD